MNLYSNLVKVEKGNRQSLLDALATMSDFDCDFIGENGADYNWDETNEGGFESNLDYLLNEIKDIKDDNEAVQVFIEEWMDRDSNYYDEYSFDTITDDDGNVLAISFATATDH